jgi:hypothetical protein
MKFTFAALGAAAALALVLSAPAGAATVTVAGTSNPFLAGAPNGSSCCGGGTPDDTAPAESPAFAAHVVGGSVITVTGVTGDVLNFPSSSPSDGPNGDPTNAQSVGPLNGISGFTNAPINALVGVFLGSTLSGAAPASLDFSAAPTTTPALQQIFFIGDGSLGSFVAPTDATRLYLGTIDGYQWSNNSGAFNVTLTGGVPEPTTWAMMLVGFGGLGVAMRSRRRQFAAA